MTATVIPFPAHRARRRTAANASRFDVGQRVKCTDGRCGTVYDAVGPDTWRIKFDGDTFAIVSSRYLASVFPEAKQPVA